MKNIIFVAAPAAGKGSYSNILKEKYGYIHISTGDMLREAIASHSELGMYVKNIIDNGNLVSDDIMIKLIDNKLKEIKGKPFILDGFPRTLNQAISLENLIDNYIVIYLTVDKDLATRRMTGRRNCECGKSYNIYEDEFKPKVDNICDICGKKLLQRADDNKEAFEIRFNTFVNNSKPIKEYYEGKDKLVVIDSNRNVNEVFKDISEVIND